MLPRHEARHLVRVAAPLGAVLQAHVLELCGVAHVCEALGCHHGSSDAPHTRMCQVFHGLRVKQQLPLCHTRQREGGWGHTWQKEGWMEG